MDKDQFYLTLGKKITAIREDRGFSLSDLASFVETKSVALNKGSLSMIEKGERPISAYLLFCIAEFLHTPIQDFFLDESDTSAIKSDEDKKEVENL